MGPTNEDFRAAIARTLGGRSVAGSATAHGMPRDAIRRVMQGHDPRLSRADDICRALDITFTLGLPQGDPRFRNHPEPGSGAGPSAPAARSDARSRASTETSTDRDRRLAELLVRVAERWEHLDGYERERLASGISAMLDLSGGRGARRR